MNSQQALTDQIDALIALANEKGLYDAADHIRLIKEDRDNAVRMSNAADRDRVRLHEENQKLKEVTVGACCPFCEKEYDGPCDYCWKRQIYDIRRRASKAFHDPERYPSLPWIQYCIDTCTSMLEPCPVLERNDSD